MPQTVGQLSGKTSTVELSAAGTAWTAIGGSATTLAPSGGGRQRSEAYTFDGDSPLVTIGKGELFDITVTGLYTEIANELFEFVRPIFEAGGDLHVRFTVKGAGTGNFIFTAGPGKVTALTYPSITAADATPVMTGFVWRGPRPVKSSAV